MFSTQISSEMQSDITVGEMISLPSYNVFSDEVWASLEAQIGGYVSAA